MRAAIAIWFCLILAGCGPGLSDFSEEIYPGWSIHRSSRYDIVIGRTDSTLPYTTSETLGPLSGYAITDGVIYARHYGGSKSGPAASRTVDKSRALYVVIDTQSGKVEGPLESLDVGELTWTKL